MKLITISLFLFIPSVLYSQFDSLIFLKDGIYLSQNTKEIYALGDQNDDGCDDIMIYDCSLKQALVFFGGSPMDTTVDVAIPMNLAHSITTIDLNNDGKDDIILAEKNDTALIITMKVYWGGSQLDSIPDLIFSPPEYGGTLFRINDFNGDGRNEFTYLGYFESANGRQYYRYYFYNTESEFDTIPHYTISGDSINYVRISGLQSGDINGDGISDLMIYGTIGYNPPYTEIFQKFYLGNSDWDLIEDQVIYQSEQTFDIGRMHIIKDINNDGRDDILMIAYGGIYPFYWHNSILHGSFPVDTLQDVGLNTQNEALNIASYAPVGDVNGDGLNDIFIQTLAGYPDVKLWLGSPTMYELPAKQWEGLSSGFGRLIGAAGDVNGDGVNDIAIAEIPFVPQGIGKIYIYMGDTSVVTEVNEKDSPTPGSFKLFAPYPNPFNPTTRIKFEISGQARNDNTHITLKVYDVLGREITTLINEDKPVGEYEVKFDGTGLPSGVYFYQLRSGSFVETKKMVLLK